VCQKHKTFREIRKIRRHFPHFIRKNPRSMYPQAMLQFVLEKEKLSHIIGTAPILEMARAYGLRPRNRPPGNPWLLSKLKPYTLFVPVLCQLEYFWELRNWAQEQSTVNGGVLAACCRSR